MSTRSKPSRIKKITAEYGETTADPGLSTKAPFIAQTLFDHIPDVVFFTKNREGQYTSLNQTLVARSGKGSKQDLLGLTPSQVLGKELGRTYEEQDQKIIDSGEALVDQMELHVYPDQRVGWCMTSKYPLVSEENEIVGIVGISRDIQSPDVTSDDFEKVASALRFAKSNLSDPPTIGQLAARAGFSPYQLDRRLKFLFGLSTGQWLLKSRMDHASELLRKTNTSIAEIAFECGYSDQSAFARQFRKITGQTPQQFRKLGTREGA